MDRDLSHLPAWYRRIARSEDTLLGFWLSLLVFPVLLTLAGFYIGTIVISPHVVDLQVHDLEYGGLPGAAIGLILGLVIFVFMATVYPSHKEREDAYEEALYHSHHGGHHDEIAADFGQQPREDVRIGHDPH